MALKLSLCQLHVSGLFSGWRATTISCPKWPLYTWCLFINLGLGAGAAVVEALQAIADLRAEFP